MDLLSVRGEAPAMRTMHRRRDTGLQKVERSPAQRVREMKQVPALDGKRPFGTFGELPGGIGNSQRQIPAPIGAIGVILTFVTRLDEYAPARETLPQPELGDSRRLDAGGLCELTRRADYRGR